MSKLNWCSDPLAESRIQQHCPGALEPILVPLANIDRAWGLLNNARGTEALNKDLVLEYATALGAGAKFPAIVLRGLLGSALLGPISGNHRVAAVALLVDMGDLALEDAQILAYRPPITDEMVLEILMRSANRQGGWRQSRVEAINHCLILLGKYPCLKAAQLTDDFGLTEAALTAELRIRKARVDLSEANVIVDGLAKGTILKLDQLSYSEPLIRLAGQLVSEYRLPELRAAALVNEMKEAGSEDMARQVAVRWREDLRKERAPAVMPQVVRKGRSRLYQQITALHSLLLTGNKGKPYNSLVEMGITDVHDRAAIGAKWREAKKHLETLFHDARKD